MSHKTVQVLGHEFDSLPAHVIADMLTQRPLRHRQTGAFKLSVVVIAETTAKRASANIYLAAKPPESGAA